MPEDDEMLTKPQIEAYIRIGENNETVGEFSVDTVRIERKELLKLAKAALADYNEHNMD